MNTRKVAALGLMLLINRMALADASYQETQQITGGTLVDTLKSQGAFLGNTVKKLFAPTNTIMMVHGNQKATVTKESTEIIDLDKEEIIRIDNEKKTYTVMTFAQMRQGLANAGKQMQQMQDKNAEQMKQLKASQPQTDLKMSFDVKVNNTGVTKMVNGQMAQEQVVVMSMKFTDPNAAATAAATPAPAAGDSSAQTVQSMAYTVTTDAWIAPDPPELQEFKDFDMRWGKKMMEGVDMSAFMESMKQGRASSNMAMGQLFGNQPGAAEAFQKMGEEMAKVKGVHVLEVTSMGGSGTGVAAPPAGSAPAPAPSGGNVAGQVATDTATQTAAGESSKLGVFGSALSNSALGAFRRKKAAPAPAPPPAAAPAGTTQTTSVVMMEMTKQQTNFSREPIPGSAFAIPAGFKQVQSPMERMGK